MAVMYKIKGFSEYEIIDKILYRKAFCTKSKSCNYQFRTKRKINISRNNGIDGFILVKNKKRKWYSLTNLRKKIIRLN